MLQKSVPTKQVLSFFLIFWTALNLLQAGFTGIHPDEAYYWLYSKFLDWGYFDHPPMVAVFIKAGDLISHSTLGLRLLTVLSSTLSAYLLWLILKKYHDNVKLFILLFSSILIFHVYGFITTPDSPLLLFVVLFFYVYQRYVQEDKTKWVVLLSLIIAGMLYSKYHGILIVVFTLLSNLKLFRRSSFWLIAGLSVTFFAPHVFWQIENGFPSVYYHLFDRSAKAYRFSYTTDYVLAQILLAGPLTGWFLYKAATKYSGNDLFIKAIRFNFYGILVFFLLSTLKGRVEAHWALLTFPCILILSYLYLVTRKLPRWLTKLAVANLTLILIARVLFIIPVPWISKLKFMSGYFNSKEWALKVDSLAGDKPVILMGGFQEASLYNFYNNTTKGFAYDTRYYRKTQFDIWPLEDSLRNHDAYYVTRESHGLSQIEDSIETEKGVYYGTTIKDARLYQKVNISTEPFTDNWKAGGLRSVKITIKNPYAEEISFSDKNETWKSYLEYAFIDNGDLLSFNSVIGKMNRFKIAASGSLTIPVIIKAPKKSGKYKLVFSIRTDPFPGSRNSGMIPVIIN
ncbi:MAG: glycosyltransferase family 39 protein [Flavobacterium sp.]|nr:glycosyltransferase family 39 protein [Pedobacter sp.]